MIVSRLQAIAMLNVSPHDLATIVSPTVDLVKSEIMRVGASLAEFKIAIAFVGRQTSFDAHAYEALSPRVRRLVDLVGVSGTRLATAICDSAEIEGSLVNRDEAAGGPLVELRSVKLASAESRLCSENSPESVT